MNPTLWLGIGYALVFFGIGGYIAILAKENVQLRKTIDELSKNPHCTK